MARRPSSRPNFRRRPLPAYPSKPHASGQARVTYRGRCHYLGVFGSPASRKEYARLVRAWTADDDELPPVQALAAGAGGAGATVDQLVARWVEAAESERGADDKEILAVRRATLPLCRKFGSLAATEFGTLHLQMVRQSMLSGEWMTPEDREHPRAPAAGGWCRNVVNRAVSRIRRVWRWAEEQQFVRAGAWHHLQSLRPLPPRSQLIRETEPRKPALWDDILAVLPEVPPPVAAMIQLQTATGMRPGEVVKMRAGDVSEDSARGVFVYQMERDKSSWRGALPPAPVPLGPEAMAALRPWLDAAAKLGPATYLFRPIRRKGGSGHYRVEAYARAIGRACRKLGVRSWTPYQIRHLVKRIVTREEGLDAARAVLRQRTVDATAHYDREIDTETAAKIARKIG